MNAEAYTIGVDLGGTNMVAAVMNSRGRLRAKTKVPTLAGFGPASVLERMAAEVMEVAKASGLPRARIKGVGVGSPGPLNAHKGVVHHTPNLPDWHNVPLAKIISKKTGFKVKLENDANAATVGEAEYGAGKGSANVVMLTLGTGVGGGLVIGHKLLSGPDTTAGELGHLALDPRGPLCGCGQRGCLEQFASATAIARRARALAARAKGGPLWKLCGGEPSAITAKMAHDALVKGDPSSKVAWAEAGWALGTAVAAFINIFNPDKVILGGGVMLGGRELLASTRAIAKAKAFPQPVRTAKILRAGLGDDAGVIGAAEIARQTFAV